VHFFNHHKVFQILLECQKGFAPEAEKMDLQKIAPTTNLQAKKLSRNNGKKKIR
jgi:hypothetical protein